MFRMLLLALVALALAPGTWIRTEVTQRDYSAPLAMTAIEDPKVETGSLELTGLWELTSVNDHHHGYSSLVVLPSGNLLAGSDRGRLLTIPFNNGEPLGSKAQFAFLPGRGEKIRRLIDLEALTLDPGTGDVWGAYEQSNSIERISPDGSYSSRRPLEIRRFASNSGPETLQRLSDGRFLVLGEGPEQRGLSDRPGVLFDRDPIDPVAKAVKFRFASPSGYSPVDATELPDGDILILLRRVRYVIPAQFDVALMRADPSEIAAGAVWSGEVIANLAGSDLADNFEGLAFAPDPDGSGGTGSLYLISDDNTSVFQRSLLARLAWPPEFDPQDQSDATQKARE